MPHRGFVKIYRKCLDGALLRNAQTWQFLSWALLKATHAPYKHPVGTAVVDLEPGQFVFGRASAARDLNTTERKIRTALETLKNIGFLTIKTTNKFSVVTIVNWHSYQGERPASDQQNDQHATSKRPTNDHKQEQSTKNKKDMKTLSASASPDAVRTDDEPFYLTKKKRRLTGKRLVTFNQFWAAFAYPKGKAEAADAWIDVPEMTNALVERIISAAEREATARPGLVASGHTPKWAQGWITGKRWEDEHWCPPPGSQGIKNKGKSDVLAHNMSVAATVLAEREFRRKNVQPA